MSITGISAINRKLGSIKAAIESSRLERAAAEWARVEFLPRAQALVPVRSGTLRDSISFAVNPNQVLLFADAPYAMGVEFGTYKMVAQPFMRPAYNTARFLLSKYTRRVIREALR
ncbi:MAG: hypothetical protein K2X80_04060 [Pseudomonadaceae bacterium]|nr:hypothetical protein [Pseudomonadaceae bacterium]